MCILLFIKKIEVIDGGTEALSDHSTCGHSLKGSVACRCFCAQHFGEKCSWHCWHHVDGWVWYWEYQLMAWGWSSFTGAPTGCSQEPHRCWPCRYCADNKAESLPSICSLSNEDRWRVCNWRGRQKYYLTFADEEPYYLKVWMLATKHQGQTP